MLTKGALVLQLFQIENRTMRTILVLIVDNVPGLVGDVPVGLSHVCCLHVHEPPWDQGHGPRPVQPFSERPSNKKLINPEFEWKHVRNTMLYFNLHIAEIR